MTIREPLRGPCAPGNESYITLSLNERDGAQTHTSVMLLSKLCSWILSSTISLGVVVLGFSTDLKTRAQSNDPPRHSTNLTNSVQWDNYTLWVDGQRIFLQYVSLSVPIVGSDLTSLAVRANSTRSVFLSRTYGLTYSRRWLLQA